MSNKTSDNSVANIEDEIKEIKEFIEEAYRCYDYDLDYNPFSRGIAEMVEHILAEREEMLKAINTVEKEKGEWIEECNQKDKQIKELEELVAKFKTVDYMFRIDSYSNRYDMRRIYFEWLDSIPKQAVINKIEELKEFRTALPVGHLKEAQIKVLQELLELEGEK